MMKEPVSMEGHFRYDCSGEWFKGNLHLHTDHSDGNMTVTGACAYYAERGYDFISITDHMIPFDGAGSDGQLPIMILDGIELWGDDDHGAHYHIVCIGGVEGISEDMALLDALRKARSQGSIIIWAHPHWTGNTVADGMRHGFHGLEIYNHSCDASIGKGYGVFHWDAALEQQPDLLGFATDDNHFVRGYPPQVGGWIMVNASEFSQEAITESIQRGNFYSSRGPDFTSITIEKGNRVVATTSPVAHARLIGPATKGKWKAATPDGSITETHFRIPRDWAFARLEIEDTHGKKAWSNPLLTTKGQ